MKRILAFLIATSLAASAIAAAPKPLQIFILAGQSNMQGHAKVSTFEHIGMDPATRPMLAGISNLEFHHLGSAKILGVIGQGLAGAMAELKQLKRAN